MKKREEEELKELRPSKIKPEKEVEEIVNRLFLEKDTLKVNREKETEAYLKEVYPFKPNIKDKTEPKMKNFVKRLELWKDKYEKLHLNLKEKANFDYDTGHALFKPHTGKIREKSCDRDLFQELYQDRKRRDKILKDNDEKNLLEFKQRAKSRSSISKTDLINDKHKEECFTNLFVVLDYDNDGIISYSQEFIENAKDKLSEDVLSLLDPLFEELNEHSETLTFEEFLLALQQLFNVFNVDQKRRILNWYTFIKRENNTFKKNDYKKDFSFHPKISEASINLYSTTERFTSKSFLDRNNDLLESREQHSNIGKQNNIEEELKGNISLIFNI